MPHRYEPFVRVVASSTTGNNNSAVRTWADGSTYWGWIDEGSAVLDLVQGSNVQPTIHATIHIRQFPALTIYDRLRQVRTGDTFNIEGIRYSYTPHELMVEGSCANRARL